MPEVGGDAACYFDPFNVEEMSEGLRRVLMDEPARREWIRKGRERVKEFSAERMAQRTAGLYRAVLAGGVAGGNTAAS